MTSFIQINVENNEDIEEHQQRYKRTYGVTKEHGYCDAFYCGHYEMNVKPDSDFSHAQKYFKIQFQIQYLISAVNSR